jgi:hypothetical protein
MNTSQRATFHALADVLLPGIDNLPAPSTIAISDRWLDRALAARPDLASTLETLLIAADGHDPDTELRRLRTHDRDAFDAFTLIATGAYYMHPTVRKRIGYPGQKPDPPPDDEADYWLRDNLLDPVTTRGAIWRQAPD